MATQTTTLPATQEASLRNRHPVPVLAQQCSVGNSLEHDIQPQRPFKMQGQAGRALRSGYRQLHARAIRELLDAHAERSPPDCDRALPCSALHYCCRRLCSRVILVLQAMARTLFHWRSPSWRTCSLRRTPCRSKACGCPRICLLHATLQYCTCVCVNHTLQFRSSAEAQSSVGLKQASAT